MARQWRPLRTNCIVAVERVEEKSKGGIILTKDFTSKESMAKEVGVVLALGPDFNVDGIRDKDVKIGDTVAFARYGGKQLEENLDGKEIRVMRDIDILAVLEEDK